MSKLRLEDRLGPINCCEICEHGPCDTPCESWYKYHVFGEITVEEFMEEKGMKVEDVPDEPDSSFDRF